VDRPGGSPLSGLRTSVGQSAVRPAGLRRAVDALFFAGGHGGRGLLLPGWGSQQPSGAAWFACYFW